MKEPATNTALTAQEAAEAHLNALGMDKGDVYNECRNLFLAGAEWQKTQRMEVSTPDKVYNAAYNAGWNDCADHIASTH